jgi:hypothetical protein
MAIFEASHLLLAPEEPKLRLPTVVEYHPSAIDHDQKKLSAEGQTGEKLALHEGKEGGLVEKVQAASP